jgi:hypothetical protein
VFDLGVPVVAPTGPEGPEGPEGPQGPQGPTGQAGNFLTVVVNTPTLLPSNGEWKTWSFVALKMAEYYSANMVSAALSSDWFETYEALYRFANMVVPLDNIVPLTTGFTPQMIAAVQSNVNIRAAAELIYCKFVNNLQLADVQLAQISTELGNPLLITPIPENAPAIIAAEAMWQGRAVANGGTPSALRAYISNLRMGAYGEQNLPDFTLTTTCTPNYEDWNKVWDFTIDNGGWLDRRFGQGVESTYNAGVGWGRVGTNTAMWCRYEFPQTVNLLQIEAIFSPYEVGNLHRAGSGASSSESYSNLVQTNPPVGLPQAILAWQGTRTTNSLAINMTSTAGTGRLVRVSIAGSGYNPF